MTARAWAQVPADLWGQLAQDVNTDDQVELDYSIPSEPQEPDRG